MFLSLHYLLKSGITLFNALNIAKDILIPEYSKKISNVIFGLKQGKELSYLLQKEQLGDKIILELIKTGEMSGEMENVLFNISNLIRERELDYVEKVVSLIEPILIFFLSLLILWIALSLFLPLWDLTKINP